MTVVDVNRRFEKLSSCIRPFLGWTRCTSDGDDGREPPLASAGRRFAVSRRLRDWSVLVDQLNDYCADSRPPGKAAQRRRWPRWNDVVVA